MNRPAVHPGEVLADELRELKLSAAALSRSLHVPAGRVTQILRGQRAITADTALRIGYFLGTGGGQQETARPTLITSIGRQYHLLLDCAEITACAN